MTVRLDISGGIARVVLARPERLNAFSDEMKDRLIEITRQLQLDERVRAVLLCAEGRAFCAGGDIDTMGASDVLAARARIQHAHRALLGLANLDKPVIAAVRGAALGVGFSLALSSDLLIASTTARFGVVFKKVGLAPDGGLAYFLSQSIGARRAKELMLSARMFGAEEARALGLVAEVVDDETLDARAMAVTEELASSATFALAMGKRMFRAAGPGSLEDFLDFESHAQNQAAQTHDHQEGAAAFREKRAPVFLGR